MLSKVMILARQTFKNYPLATNSVIYGSLIVTAEFSQQTVNKKILTKPTEPYDTVAFGRYAAYGTGIAGPLLFVWFKWLDSKYVGVASRIVTKKILLDQFFFTPQLCVIFYVAMSIMEHKEDILKECKEKFTPTFIKSCCFWLPAQTVNFLMVPPQLRVIYVATCSFAWVNILCWMKRQLSKAIMLARQTFKHYPLVTNSVIYGSLIVGAEFSQQTVNKKILTKPTEPYDTVVFGRYAAYGTGIAGPLLYFWFKWLDKRYVGVAARIVTKKILLDQFLFSPQLLAIFYIAMSIMERKEDILKECKEKITPTFINCCCFWFPAQTVNFLMVPPQLRVIYVATCSFAWVNILCWMKRQET